MNFEFQQIRCKKRLTKPLEGKISILFDIYVSVEQNSFARVKQGIKISPTCNRAFCEPRHSAGAGGVTRTRDLRITNALLYQLSYTSTKYTEKLLQIIPNCAKIISENIGITLYIILSFLILSREAVKNES